jgi:hypothetical protein
MKTPVVGWLRVTSLELGQLSAAVAARFQGANTADLALDTRDATTGEHYTQFVAEFKRNLEQPLAETRGGA